ncbi:MAG: dTDP-4-dehydrorhamnose reductase [Phycisphaerales bacterium]|nr:dTDP-4-dehydrorhamnose reductase [Phycisphaerales bacterium]
MLLLGADGMLGRAVAGELRGRGWGFAAPSRREFDLANARTLERATTWREPEPPGLVINCAAWTDVDGAETREAEATAVNGGGVASLAGLCFSWEALLVTYSTDYVFDGQGSEPYQVDVPRAPLNAYGRSKAVGEEAVEASHADWLNIRTSWLYAPWGKNFVLTIRKLLFEKPSIKVVDDQRGRPTSAQHLARTTMSLIDRRMKGHWHVTDGGDCTWFEFAREIGRLAGAPGRVEPCTSAEFPRPAKRPAYSVLDISETERAIGEVPDWRANLADVVARLE